MSQEESKNAPNKDHEDLLRKEVETGLKYELIDGELILMSGGTGYHNAIAANLISIFKRIFNDTKCVVFSSDMKLKVEKKNSFNYYYPDVSVQCKEIDLNEVEIEKPFLLVEVLSKSTASTDKVKKLNDYLSIEELSGYLIVDQWTRRIELWRSSDKMEIYNSGEQVNISEKLNFNVNEVYDGLF